jgi:hypothetical protein
MLVLMAGRLASLSSRQPQRALSLTPRSFFDSCGTVDAFKNVSALSQSLLVRFASLEQTCSSLHQPLAITRLTGALQYMRGAVREKRVFALLLCDAALMLLMLVGLVGCLLFWLGAQLLASSFERALPASRSHLPPTVFQARTLS